MNKFTFTCPHTYTLGLSASSTMNNCVGFLNGANRSVQIPPNALYSGAGLAAAINLLTNPYNITCAYVAGSQLFTFTDTTSANPFIILSTSTCLINLGFSAVQNWTSALIPITCTLVSPCIIEVEIMVFTLQLT